eukprot:350351-Chlamydomonas_euryale.AAC.5
MYAAIFAPESICVAVCAFSSVRMARCFAQVRRLLSGPFDEAGARLSINAVRAGGRENFHTPHKTQNTGWTGPPHAVAVPFVKQGGHRMLKEESSREATGCSRKSPAGRPEDAQGRVEPGGHRMLKEESSREATGCSRKSQAGRPEDSPGRVMRGESSGEGQRIVEGESSGESQAGRPVDSQGRVKRGESSGEARG